MRFKFIVFVLLQALLLIGIIAYRDHWVSTGERIILKTVPVDPRDIFRGDYVRLDYEITNLDLDKLSFKEKFSVNEKIFVKLLKSDDSTYRPVSVSKEIPSEGTFIQGRVRYYMPVALRWEISLKDDTGNIHTLIPRWNPNIKKGERLTFCLGRMNTIQNYYKDDAQYKPQCSTKTLAGIIEDTKEFKLRQAVVEYGIESYFVEEGQGRKIETARNAQELRVEVSLRKDGKGIITGLILDGNLLLR